MTVIYEDRSIIRDPDRIREISIIGEGKMGTGIFTYLGSYPFTLNWICSRDADVAMIRDGWMKRTGRAIRTGIIDESEASRRNSFPITTDIKAAMNSDLVIEAITEDPDEKRVLFEKLDSVVPAQCIFATNSSSILPEQLVVSEMRAERTLGLHFFYPLNLKSTVEFIVTRKTSGQVIADIESLLKKIRMRWLFQDGTTAFSLNRIFLDFQVEAFRIVEEGLSSIPEVERITREHLFPLGPFSCIDSVGLDIMIPAVTNYSRMEGTGEACFPLLDAMTVRKTRGKGFVPEIVQKIKQQTSDRVIIDMLRQALITGLNRFTDEYQSRGQLLNALREYTGNDNLIL